MEVLRDSDVQQRVTPRVAREAMREAVIAAYRGQLLAPPRAAVDLGPKRLAFTCGGVEGQWYGFRSYVAPGSTGDEQVVVVHDASTGSVVGLAVGEALGPRRVGAIGGIALEALAPLDACAIALLGAGTQAWHQLWALPDRFRSLPVRVYSRDAHRRAEFAAKAREELRLDVEPKTTARDALNGADIILLATSSNSPVLSAADIPPGAYVATLGPKQVGRSEFGPDLTQNAALVCSDSVEQLCSYQPPHVLAAHGLDGDVVPLGAVLTGEQMVPPGIRIFLSNGLAGTEAWLLQTVLQQGWTR